MLKVILVKCKVGYFLLNVVLWPMAISFGCSSQSGWWNRRFSGPPRTTCQWYTISTKQIVSMTLLVTKSYMCTKFEETSGCMSPNSCRDSLSWHEQNAARKPNNTPSYSSRTLWKRQSFRTKRNGFGIGCSAPVEQIVLQGNSSPPWKVTMISTQEK